MFDYDKITLDSIAGGAALEKFQDELKEVFKNILDINTDPVKTREVKLILKLTPSKEDRAKIIYSLNVEKKLAPNNPVANIMFVGEERGDLIAYEQDVTQGSLFSNGPEDKKIVSLEQAND